MTEDLTNPEISEALSKADFTVGIFGTAGNKTETDQVACQKAAEVAAQLVESGFSISTGGYTGVMESASAAAAQKAQELGIDPKSRIKAFPFESEAVPVPMADDAEVVRSQNLPERLAHLVAESNGFIILSGSTGTLTELMVTLESDKIARLLDSDGNAKPIIIMDPSLKHTDMLSALARSDQKFKASPVLEDVYVLNQSEQANEMVDTIMDGYYQASQNPDLSEDVRKTLSQYSLKQFLSNQENVTEGAGI